MKKNPEIPVVAAALLNTTSQILLAQRPPHKLWPNLWELPGGKIERGESPEQALKRELHEELGIYINLKRTFFLEESIYDYPAFRLNMIVYVVEGWQEDIQAKVHQNLIWVSLQHMQEYPMPCANSTLFRSLQSYLFKKLG